MQDTPVFDNSGQRPLKVPGCGLPITAELPPTHRFAHGLNDWTQSRLTVREISMLACINNITDIPSWHNDIFDEAKMATLVQDIMHRDCLITQCTWDWCLLELRAKAKLFRQTNIVSVLDSASQVTKSDTLLSPSLLHELHNSVRLIATSKLQAETTSYLVDPNLFPLVYGLSPVLKYGQVGQPGDDSNLWSASVFPDIATSADQIQSKDNLILCGNIERSEGYSTHSQWLPCEVAYAPKTNAGLRITSYINNLDPRRNESLYRVIEQVLSHSIEPWNSVLAYRKQPKAPPRIQLAPAATSRSHPEPGISSQYDEWTDRKSSQFRHLQDWLRESGLQVVVEMRDIHLTPSSPYEMNSKWGVHGMCNEHVVATSAVYFDTINMTSSSGAISFQAETNFDSFEANQLAHLATLYGVRQSPCFRLSGSSSISNTRQILGRVMAPDGRLIVYPNTLQHRMDQYQLENKMESGRRRLLLLHLVDPHYKICSTRNVPPQQQGWWLEIALTRSMRTHWGFPPEIVSLVVDELGEWPITKEDAVKVRDDSTWERRESLDSAAKKCASHTWRLGGCGYLEDSFYGSCFM